VSGDPFDLARFVNAQAGVFDNALDELRAGRKRNHWMWFVFPQLKELGVSPTAQFYGLSDVAEATAYLEHPVLRPRLDRSCPIPWCSCGVVIAALSGKAGMVSLPGWTG
jgi:uncharacterized protein (DUF1810 family)